VRQEGYVRQTLTRYLCSCCFFCCAKGLSLTSSPCLFQEIAWKVLRRKVHRRKVLRRKVLHLLPPTSEENRSQLQHQRYLKHARRRRVFRVPKTLFRASVRRIARTTTPSLVNRAALLRDAFAVALRMLTAAPISVPLQPLLQYPP
jgi:hypothetical protein